MALNLSPEEKWLLIGGAAVVVIAVFLHAKSSSPTTTGAQSSGSTTPPTSAISTGDLANFESAITAQQDAFLQQLQSTLTQTTPTSSGTTTQTSPTPPVTTVTGTPAPTTPTTSATTPTTGTATTSSTPPASPTPTTDNAPSAASLGAEALVPGPGGSELAVLGQISGAGGQYTGENVAGGAPVYALVNGSWVQGFDAAQLPPGTPLATSLSNAGQIVPGTTTETL